MIFIHLSCKHGRHDYLKSSNVAKNLAVDRFTPNLMSLTKFNPMKFKLTQTEFVTAKVFYREHAIAYPSHSSKTGGSPEAHTIFKKRCLKK